MKSNKTTMYSKFNLIIVTVLVLALFNFTACSDDNSTGSDYNGETPESQATINGQVEDDFAKSSSTAKTKDIQGTVVTAATISSGGSVEMMEDTETEVESSGEFTLEFDAGTAEDVVVVAENEGEELKGFISAGVENGSSYTIKPLDLESSAETDVFAQVKSEGNAEIVHKSDIEPIVTSGNAAEIYGDGSATVDVAAAVSNSAEARAEFFSEFSENAESEIDTYFESLTDAQFSLESTLNSSSSIDEEEAALDAYLETKVNAYSEADLNEKQTAEFLHAQGNVIVNSMSSVSSDVKSGARHSTSTMIAIATDNAVQASAEASGMSDATISAIADAGVSLRSDVQSSGGSENSIEAAFETYHDEVQGAMESDFSVEGTAVVTIDTEINAAGGVKAGFNSTLSGLVDVSSLTDLYINFDNDVDAIVDANSALIGDIDAEVLSDIMVLINLSS
ncbi:MAG: hypothetical protein GVY20_03600 [Bacteroidetes bacterium]|jgi:hypothetical protein|nr:hypothetical protein [Bacteroidota bacterium]